MVTATNRRVRDNTASHVNEKIRSRAQFQVEGSAAAGPDSIDERLRELDSEWDVERAIQAEAATMALLGLTLGTTRHRRWLALPGLVGSMVLLHAIQGWYPLLPLFRRLGFRTVEEIDAERSALRALRGDLTGACQPVSTDMPTPEKVRRAREVYQSMESMPSLPER